MTAARTVYSLQQAKVSPLNYTTIETSLKPISKTDFVTKNKDDGVQNLDWDAGSVPEELPEVEEQVKKCIIQGLAGADDASYAESFPGDLDLTTQLDEVKQFIDQQRKQTKAKRKQPAACTPDMEEEVESHAAPARRKRRNTSGSNYYPKKPPAAATDSGDMQADDDEDSTSLPDASHSPLHSLPMRRHSSAGAGGSQSSSGVSPVAAAAPALSSAAPTVAAPALSSAAPSSTPMRRDSSAGAGGSQSSSGVSPVAAAAPALSSAAPTVAAPALSSAAPSSTPMRRDSSAGLNEQLTQLSERLPARIQAGAHCTVGLRDSLYFKEHLAHLDYLTAPSSASSLLHRVMLMQWLQNHCDGVSSYLPVIYGVDLLLRSDSCQTVLTQELILGKRLSLLLQPTDSFNQSFKLNYAQSTLRDFIPGELESKSMAYEVSVRSREPLILLMLRAVEEFHRRHCVHRHILSSSFLIAHPTVLEQLIAAKELPHMVDAEWRRKGGSNLPAGADIALIDPLGPTGARNDSRTLEAWEVKAIQSAGRVVLVDFQDACISGRVHPSSHHTKGLSDARSVQHAADLRHWGLHPDASNLQMFQHLCRRDAAKQALGETVDKLGEAAAPSMSDQPAAISSDVLTRLLSPEPTFTPEYDMCGVAVTLIQIIMGTSMPFSQAAEAPNAVEVSKDASQSLGHYRRWLVQVSHCSIQGAHIPILSLVLMLFFFFFFSSSFHSQKLADPNWTPNWSDFFFDSDTAKINTAAESAGLKGPAYRQEFFAGVTLLRFAALRWPAMVDLLRRCSRMRVSTALEATSSVHWPPIPTASEARQVMSAVESSVLQSRNANVARHLAALGLQETPLLSNGNCLFHALRCAIKALPLDQQTMLMDTSVLSKAMVTSSLMGKADGLASDNKDARELTKRVTAQRQVMHDLFLSSKGQTLLSENGTPLDATWVLKLDEWNNLGADLVLPLLAQEMNFRWRVITEEFKTPQVAQQGDENRPLLNFVYRGANHFNAAIPASTNAPSILTSPNNKDKQKRTKG